MSNVNGLSEVIENRYKDSMVIVQKPTVTCVLSRGGILAAGSARCCPEDGEKWDRNFGIEVAYRRAKADYHAKVADERKRISRRLRAQVGEMVRRKFGHMGGVAVETASVASVASTDGPGE